MQAFYEENNRTDLCYLLGSYTETVWVVTKMIRKRVYFECADWWGKLNDGINKCLDILCAGKCNCTPFRDEIKKLNILANEVCNLIPVRRIIYTARMEAQGYGNVSKNEWIASLEMKEETIPQVNPQIGEEKRRERDWRCRN
jgi:hypothetical protein